MKIGFLVSLLLVFNQYCLAQSEPDSDWPCVQVLVPEISAASIWDGPAVDELQEDDELRQHSRELVFAVVDKLEPLTESKLDSYIDAFAQDQHNTSLAYLFKSFLASFNARRRGQIDTIKRYTQSQNKSAKVIENLMNQKADLEQQGSAEQVQEIESRLYWQKRIQTV